MCILLVSIHLQVIKRKINSKKRGKSALPLDCQKGRIIPKPSASLIWPKTVQLISTVNRSPASRKLGNCKCKVQPPKEKKMRAKWRPTHVKEVFSWAALCAAGRGRRDLRGHVPGVDVGGHFSQGGRRRFSFRRAVDVQGPCNQKTTFFS